MAMQTEQLDPTYFAKEREGDFNVIGTTVQRSDALGHVTGRTRVLRGRQPRRDCCTSRCTAPSATTRCSKTVDVARRAGGPRRGARPHPRGRAGQLVHDPQADRRRAERRAGAGRGPRALHGRADRRGGRESEEAARARAPPRSRSTTRTCRRCSTSRRRWAAARPRSSRTARTTSSTRAITAGGSASATSSRASPRPTTSSSGATSPRRSSTRRPRRPAASSMPQADGRLKIHSDTQACFFTLDNTALILDVPFGKLRVVGGHGRRRLRRQGRRDRRADRLHRRDADQQAGQVRLRPRGGDAGLLAARRRADLHQGRRDGRRADRRAQGHAVRRRRRLLPPHARTATTKAAAHMPGPYNIPNVWVDAHCVYTNRTPSSAMRGFGVTIADFALESQMDRIARALDMDPLAAPAQERLPRRRHEGAPQARGGHRADRGDPAGGRAGRPRAAATSTGDVVEHGGALRWPCCAAAASPRSTTPPA